MNQTNRTCLTASPDPKIREMIREVLLKEGCESISCGDGEEAIESAKAQVPQSPICLIILETHLPKFDGHEVVNQLSKLAATNQTPVLMLIDRNANSLGTKIMNRLRADDYLGKPFDIEEIRQKVHTLIHHFREHAATHPLTGLAGHPQLEEEIFIRLGRGEKVTLLWIDINYFRPFNDHYGRGKGNEVIREMVHLIQETLQSAKIQDEGKSLITHVDGDDFIILLPEDKVDEVKQNLRKQFQTNILKFYSSEEKEKGFIYQKDRDNKEQIFPLMTLSMCVVQTETNQFSNYGALVLKAEEMLRQAKIGSQEIK